MGQKKGEQKECIYCHKMFPAERPFDYCIECSRGVPKEHSYVVAGFGTKGNGAHVTRFTHGEV